MVMGTSYLFSHLRKFGLKMHVGSGTTASKTEAMYYPTSMGSCEGGDTTAFTVSGLRGKDLGFVSFTKEFKYLGPIVHSSLTSDSGQRPLEPPGACLETSASRGPSEARFIWSSR